MESKVELEFVAPGADFVGFEYPPKTPAQKKLLKKATDNLKTTNFFEFDERAKCEQKSFSLDQDHHTHGKSNESHLEYRAIFQYYCPLLNRLNWIQTDAFKYFKSLHTIQAQFVSSSKQLSKSLKKGESRLEGIR